MSPANSAAIASLWSTDYKRLVNWAKHRLRDANLAEDIVMQSFAQLGAQMESAYVAEPRLLMQSIMHRRIVDAVREKVNRPPTVSFDLEGPEQDSFGSLVYATPGDTFPADFDQAVRELPEPERDAFILTELRGLTVREAADVLGTSKSDVDRRASSARTSIRKELAA